MDRHRYTVLPFLLTMFVAVAAMPTNVYQICRNHIGHLEIEPWLERAAAAVASAIGLSWCVRLWRRRVPVLAAAALLALLAVGLAEHAPGVLLATAAAGATEPTLAEVKSAIESSNRLFEEFKRTNDERLRQIEQKGVADPLLQEKLTKLDADIAKSSALADAFSALEAKMNRLEKFGASGEEVKSFEAELKAFNLELRSDAIARGQQVPPQQMTADEYRAYKQAFNVYLRRGDRALGPDDVRALQVGVDADGGYLVTPDMSGRIVRRVFETSPIMQIANVQPIGTDKLEGLRDIDEASGGGWVGETGGRTATTTPQFGKWEIPVHEQYENPGATQKLIDDASINVEAWLSQKVADKIARRRNTAFVTGDGVAKPRGFASYTTAATADASRAWGQLEHLLTGTNGGFGADPNGADKLIELAHKPKQHFRANARWVMPRATLGAVRRLKDTNGSYIWLPTMQAGQPSQLLGYATTEAEDMAAYTTTGALGIAFGDFHAGYQVVERIGIRVLRDPYTNKPYIQFYTTARVGGDVIDFEAIKFLKFSA